MNIRRISILVLLTLVWILVYFNLQAIIDFLIDEVLKLEAGTHFTESLRFFLFEVPKVLLLLVLIIFVVGVIRSYFSPEKTKKSLEGKPLFAGNLLASGLGVVTPFCSCSAIPLFLGFVEAGIPVGVTFSFLIAAPMVNEVALVLLVGLFGWKVALIYTLTGLTIASLSGFVIEKMKLQKYVAPWVYEMQTQDSSKEEKSLNFSDRLGVGLETLKEIVGKIWLYIIIGIAIGAGAHGYVPENFLSDALGAQNWYSVPLAIIVGIPLYSNAAGIVPIVSVLIEKGVSLGTALAFMMSIIGLSLPEIIILKKVLRWPLIVAFVSVVAIGILLVGFVFNYFFIT